MVASLVAATSSTVLARPVITRRYRRYEASFASIWPRDGDLSHLGVVAVDDRVAEVDGHVEETKGSPLRHLLP